MAYAIRFSEEKNQLLQATRGICFDDVLDAFVKEKLLADIRHPSKKYVSQRIYVVEIGKYAYAVPYIINVYKREIFLKTMYPSRVLTKKYMKGVEYEKTKK